MSKRIDSETDAPQAFAENDFCYDALDIVPHQSCHAASLIPIGNIYVGLLINMTAVGGAEPCGRNFGRSELIFGPLSFVRVVSEKSNRRVVLVEDRDASF